MPMDPDTLSALKAQLAILQGQIINLPAETALFIVLAIFCVVIALAIIASHTLDHQLKEITKPRPRRAKIK